MTLGPHRIFIDEARQIEPSDPEEFDRVSFTLDAVRALGQSGLTVAVYRSHSGLRVHSALDLRGGEGARWVMMGVPARASRAQIAHALANLAGVTGAPWALDVLLNAGRNTV